MAGTDPQKQLFALLRDFATENSQGERRIVGLKKRIQELRSELELTNAELEDTKRLKENTEQEIKGYEVELAMNEASTQTLEARVSLIHEEISVAGSGLEALKNEEGALRDDFIDKMFVLNADISESNVSSMDFLSSKGKDLRDAEDAEVSRRALENQIAELVSQTNIEEQECQAELNARNQFLLKIVYTNYQSETHAALPLSVTHYPLIECLSLTGNKLSSELEEKIASLGEELQKRCLCPSCGLDNAEALGGILQASDGSY
ncbi:hypothetical protein RHGRI_028303 [Rhododendron griersonianum]|uniref:Uncharacterized protein n=1 Tax=Rhododendron griersonianum TaxID=479676 RepID=A0AAV6IFA9_9ERIC|nr:hypothetical protein RHGRI_028303 [Rhododendron griersonianum]